MKGQTMVTKQSKKILCGLAIAALLLVSAVFAKEDQKAAGPKGKKPTPETRMQEKLGLTDEQVTQMEQLRTAQTEKMKDAQQLIKEKREALNEAVESCADEQAIRAAATELGNAFGDEAVLRVSYITDVKKILTPEQFEKWQQLRNPHHGLRHEKAGAEGNVKSKSGETAEGRKGHQGPHGQK
jgi:Spy/CpxP family protein refolding chaperone